MGLEVIEIAINIEEEFGINLLDEELYSVSTPLQLSDLVYQKLRTSLNEPCPSQHNFYIIRKVIMNLFNIPRESITPKIKPDSDFYLDLGLG